MLNSIILKSLVWISSILSFWIFLLQISLTCIFIFFKYYNTCFYIEMICLPIKFLFVLFCVTIDLCNIIWSLRGKVSTWVYFVNIERVKMSSDTCTLLLVVVTICATIYLMLHIYNNFQPRLENQRTYVVHYILYTWRHSVVAWFRFDISL